METFTLAQIKPLIKKMRITQGEFAARIGMDKGQFSNLLKAGDNVTYRTLQRVADGLGVSVEQLIRLCKEEMKS